MTDRYDEDGMPNAGWTSSPDGTARRPTRPTSTRARPTNGSPPSPTPELRLVANSSGSSSGTAKPTPSLPTGTRPGASGLRTLRGLLNAAADSASVDRSLTSVVEQLLGPALVALTRPDPFGPVLIDYDLYDDVPRDLLEQAIVIVGLAMAPAEHEFIVGELTRLRLVTAAQDRADEDLHAAFVFYAEELADYPADIVSSACRQLARSQTFWPALAELVSLCNQLLLDRRILQRALKRGPNVRKPTAAEIARRRQYAGVDPVWWTVCDLGRWVSLNIWVS
jgi:hypothetical protein